MKFFERKGFFYEIISFFGKKYLNFFLRNRIKKNKNLPKVLDLTSPNISISILFDDFYENDYLYYIYKNFNHLNKTCIDIGANIGNHSLFFSNYFEKVFSIEPSSYNFAILKLNTENIKNINIINCGCSEFNRKAKLYNNYKSGASNSLNLPTFEELKKRNREDELNIKRQYEIVELKTIDELFFEKENNIDLIKIDAEGEEFNCLKGGVKTIKKNKPIILFEEWNVVNGCSETINYLKDLKYDIFSFEKKHQKNLSNTLIFRFFKKIFFSKNNFILKEITSQTGGYECLVAVPTK